VRDVAIGFGGKHVMIRTDVNEVAEFVVASHRAMIEEPTSLADRTMEIRKAVKGFYLDSFFFEGSSSASFLFDLIRLRIATAFVELRPDLIWVHSGVVAQADRALMIVGPSGQGKSTLVTYLCERGWKFLSDELAPIDAGTRLVLPYPRTPARRIDPGYHVDPADGIDLDKVVVDVPIELVVTQGVAIRGIVVPTFSHGTTTVITKMTAGDAALALINSCTNFSDHANDAFKMLAQLGADVPSRRVTYGDGLDAANVLHRLNEELFTFSLHGGGSHA
jgi:hypothetical protein